MKPHPRIRKTIKWGGAAVTVLLVVVWIASGWYHLRLVKYGSWYAVICWGQLEITHSTDVKYPIEGPDIWRSWYLQYRAADQYERSSVQFVLDNQIHLQRELYKGPNMTRGFIYRLPVWTPVAFAATLTGIAWCLDAFARRRCAKLNLCPKCNYDRTGLVSQDAKCPECGTAATPP